MHAIRKFRIKSCHVSSLAILIKKFKKETFARFLGKSLETGYAKKIKLYSIQRPVFLNLNIKT